MGEKEIVVKFKLQLSTFKQLKEVQQELLNLWLGNVSIDETIIMLIKNLRLNDDL